MGRINQEIVEYNFSPDLSLTYQLNLLIGADSIYYLISDARNNALTIKSFHQDGRQFMTQISALEEAVKEDENLQLKYGATKIAVFTPHFALIPQKFYDHERRSSYFSPLTLINSSATLVKDFIKIYSLYNLYPIDLALINQIKRLFPESSCQHSSTRLIEGFRNYTMENQSLQLFLNIRDGYAQFCLFESKQLIYANAFPFHAPEDVAYFALSIFEQFKIDADFSALIISGAITEDSEIFNYLFRFIRKVNFIVDPDFIHFGRQFTGTPPHFYFDLYNGLLCE